MAHLLTLMGDSVTISPSAGRLVVVLQQNSVGGAFSGFDSLEGCLTIPGCSSSDSSSTETIGVSGGAGDFGGCLTLCGSHSLLGWDNPNTTLEASTFGADSTSISSRNNGEEEPQIVSGGSEASKSDHPKGLSMLAAKC
jgi:hypothetical protein